MTEPSKNRPGWKTTEFWITLVLTAAGLVTASGAFGAESEVVRVAGLVLSLGASLGYKASRTAVKKASIILILILPLVLVGCPGGMIRASEVKDTWGYVRSTHDQLIDKGTVTMDGQEKKPSELSDLEKRTLKRNTASFQKAMDSALEDE